MALSHFGPAKPQHGPKNVCNRTPVIAYAQSLKEEEMSIARPDRSLHIASHDVIDDALDRHAPKGFRPFGHSDDQRVTELTEDWWQWAVQLPSGENPFEDPTREYASLGDVGRVFFLAGIGGNTDDDPSDVVAVEERSFEIPFGRTLLVPALNWADSIPQNPGLGNAQDLAEEMQLFKSWVSDVFVELDGRTLFGGPGTPAAEAHYYQTDVFSLGTVRSGTVGADIFGLLTGVEHEPAMAGGYHAVIRHLGPGEHTLRYGGSFDFEDDGIDDFSIDITAHIEVVPPGYSGRVGHEGSTDQVFG